MLVMKSCKWHLMDEMELQNKIGTLEEKETYKYLGISEANTLKQQERKEKLRKSISEEPESYLRQNYKAKTL